MSVMSCAVCVQPEFVNHSLAALQYVSQIRDHVTAKAQKLNQDLLGQSIQTIESELNMMQLKLEQQLNSDIEVAQDTELFGKLMELI